MLLKPIFLFPEDSDVDQLLTSTGTYLATSSALSSGALQIKRCRDANAEAPSKVRRMCESGM